MTEETKAIVVHQEQAMEVQQPMSSRDMLEQVAHIQNVMHAVMKEGEHFGTIPGCGPKKTLLKPGAEKLGMTFGLVPSFIVTMREYGEHREYEVICELKARASGRFMGAGVGICSTKEAKYRYRGGDRKCPQCGKATIIKGKKEFGGGWLCFAKKGGCGAKWPDGAQEIESQSVDKVEHENPADFYNTVLKMAKKRAHVDAIITATAASDIFAQDLEDLQANGLIEEPRTADAPPAGSEPGGREPPKKSPPRASSKKKASDKQKGMIKGVMAQAGLPDTDYALALLEAVGANRTSSSLKKYGVEDVDAITHEQLRDLRDGVEYDKDKPGILAIMTSAQASALIEKYKPAEDGAARAQALEIFNNVVAQYGPEDVYVEELMHAHFKVKTTAKLTAEQLTKLAELVEAHAKPQPTEDDLPEY